MHICFKIIKFLLHSTLLYMFWTLLCPSLGAYGSNNRTGLEDATNTTPNGNQMLHVRWWKAPDDGHSGVEHR
jgi:hypothetical protein